MRSRPTHNSTNTRNKRKHPQRQDKPNVNKRNQVNIRRKYRRPRRGSNGTTGSSSSQRGRSRNQPSLLRPVNVKSNSIHNDWKTQLGGIIRYYINTRNERNHTNSHSDSEAMKEIEQMYFKNGCNVDKTKDDILLSMGAIKNEKSNWVDISMAIDMNGSIVDEEEMKSYEQPRKNVLKLKNIVKGGEGPAHAHEQWTNIIVPSWAIGKAYFFQMNNNSPLPLSCEMTIDDHKVARNVPIPANSSRNVHPDNARYFQRHQWVIQPAKKMSLQDALDKKKEKQQQSSAGIKLEDDDSRPIKKYGKRYNYIRPKYRNERVSLSEFPDPSMYGWTFTGSSEQSKVEFFEKNVNLGLVKLDFYYTTATVKTTLVHPSTGRNSLFRNTVTPDIYRQILMNPRSHTNRGYRDRANRPPDVVDLPMMDSDDEMEECNNDDIVNKNIVIENGEETINHNMDQNGPSPNYARNDDYDFDNDGHTNRASEMSKLEKTDAFSAWEDAARKEWACIHVKFYVSLPKRNMMNPQFTKRRVKKIKQEALPQQAPVINIKSAERATLGTQFQATGPVQTKNRSMIFMKRIVGLNDDEKRRSAPVFEYKLFYRAQTEDVHDDIEEEDMDDMDDIEAESNNTDNLTETLLHENNLNEFKNEKTNQLTNWHQTNTFKDPDEADLVLKNRIDSINEANTVEMIDHIVQEYYQWLQKLMWDQKE